ncbi:T9SS type A sorting domain-containing protein [Pseudoflavitalea sp. X16]|uniref:FG-GAP-like repeat-containing protein n=1 Tax=Paraflavitalea devenefica TaxID=2716334 RepID=UPI00142194C2|nr:FG-GAP-like repeat-containing protein [Paraflavitalea devenefica]NII29487.1 T9SS type A sorting domain-containing protein [Paraflavitalea devenefica]
MRILLPAMYSLLIAIVYQPFTTSVATYHRQSPPNDWYTAALAHIRQEQRSETVSTYNPLPVYLASDSVLEGPGRAEATFGASVAGAGDVNGDGYSDVIIGAPLYDSLYAEEGRAYVYYGTPSGLPVIPSLSLSYHSNTDGHEHFGSAVSGAGDINGDGYADIIIGAPFASDDGYELAIGHALVYYGSATGIPATADTILKGDMPFAFYGISVAGAGDINGDGYSDVIVGASEYGYTIGFPNGSRGRVFVYYGSPAGLQASDYVEGDQYLSMFGKLVAGAGDVNGDGYSDIAVSAPNYHVYAPNADGAVFIYHGSDTGLTTTYANLFTNAQPIAATGFSQSMAGGGDLDGDGYTDLVLSQPFYYDDPFNNPTHTIARLLIYYGSATGLPASPVILDSTGRPGLALGGPIGHAGDVNGDGFADIAVAGADTNTHAHASRLLLYHGAAAGLTDTLFDVIDTAAHVPVPVLAGAGDVNGDGYADIVMGEPAYDAGDSTNAGRAYMYHGAPDSIDEPPAVTFDSPGNTVIGFGRSVQYAGDINGDGYSDVVIGDPNFIKGMTNYEGRAYVYYGSASGLPPVPDVTLDVNNPNCKLGWAVAGAGDVNGDGYADVMIGAPRYNDTEGGVFVYYGSAAGLVNTPDTISTGLPNYYLGYAIAGAGDVNGDGYDDVLVSAYNDIVTVDTGKVLVYYGAASGLPPTPNLILQGVNETDKAGFGRSVASAGDVNGDGYGDVVIGAPYSNDGSNTLEGRAYVFLGSGTGLSATPAAILDNANQDYAFFGSVVAGAGDINGDGYTDVLVNAPEYNNGSGIGRAFIYLGSGSGISATPSDTLIGNDPSNTHLGHTVASAGDVNSDGYADVLVTDEQFDTRGIVLLFKGSPTGLEAVPDSIDGNIDQYSGSFGSAAVTAGDVNADGFSDILIGNLLYNTIGRVYLYYGNQYGGQRNNLRLYNANLTTPLSALNITEPNIGAGLFVQSPQGRQKGRLVWETRAVGNAFSGVPVTNSTSYSGRQATFTNLGLTGTELKNEVSKTGKATLLRARVEYDPVTALTGQRYGPWRYPLGIGRSAGILLPLDILTFTGVKQGREVLLKWTVASYEAGVQYTLERSADGRHYIPLHTTAAKPGVTYYQWRDEQPLWGKNYFRLVVDDGVHQKHTRAVVLVFEETRSWVIYPNPVRAGQALTIQLPAATGALTAQLTDGHGRVVKQQHYAASNGLIRMGTQGLAAGHYNLIIRTGGKIITKNVVVLER